MTTYQKGSAAERELIKILKENGFFCMRAAGSGVVGDTPDVLAVKRDRTPYGFEAKAWKNTSLSIEKEKYRDLINWHIQGGVGVHMAWKIPYKGWLIIPITGMRETAKAYVLTLTEAHDLGMTLEEFISLNK